MNTGLAETYYDEQQKVWSGRRRKDFFGPDVTLGEAAHFILGLNPDKVLQVQDSSGEELTAGQILRSVQVMARSLLRLGLKRGDVVGISASNTTELAAVLLGAFLCGTPTNALYQEFDKESVAIVFEITAPKIIFCEEENYKIIKEAIKQLNLDAEIYLMKGKLDGVRSVKELLVDDGAELDIKSLPCSQMTGDDTAVILCSSGTTGAPKGVLCSHNSLLMNTVITGLHSNAVVFSFSSMYWASGLWTFVASILNGVKRVVSTKSFAPDYFIELVEKHRITHIISGPHQIAQLITQDAATARQRLTSIERIICGGSMVPQVVSEKFNALLGTNDQRVGLAVCYGMSELGMLSENEAGPASRREGSVGKLMPNMKVKIVHKTTGEMMGINGKGIVYVYTPFKWYGYHRNPEASRNAYQDGWLVTGDIGYFDADGFLHICARENDVFKSNNFQIYPSQIEDVVMELPGVLEACIFGVPDFVLSNLTACAVVRTNNAQGRSLTEQDVVEYVSKRMASMYHIKAGVYIVDALPKTGSGKVQRRKVLEMIRGRA